MVRVDIQGNFHKAAPKAGLPAISRWPWPLGFGSVRSTSANKKALRSEVKDALFLPAFFGFLLEEVIVVSSISSQNGNISCQSSSVGGFCGHPIGSLW